MKENIKPLWALRTRFADSDPWGPPEYFEQRKARDEAEVKMRIFGGMRTYTYHESHSEARARVANSEAAQ